MRAKIAAETASFRATTMTSYYEAVQRVIRAMHEQLDEPLSLRTMARIAFVSPYHFNRVFRQITGIPPCQYLYALRLEAAKRMLVTTDLKVIEVCYAVGYNSLGTFTRRFTDLVGTSPTRLRSMAQSSIDSLANLAAYSSDLLREQASLSLAGVVSAPEGFQGLIFIGLFTRAIPQGAPVACTILDRPGPYCMPQVPDGSFYLFTAARSLSEDAKELFCYESALRGGGQLITIRQGVIRGSTDISLRRPAPSDPPILVAFPTLLTEPDLTMKQTLSTLSDTGDRKSAGL